MSTVTEAVAVMDRAGKVIDGLMAVNDRLRHENFVMLEAMENLMALIVKVSESDDRFAPGATIIMNGGYFQQAQAAVKLAKGEQS